jgi:hypothetical protein
MNLFAKIRAVGRVAESTTGKAPPDTPVGDSSGVLRGSLQLRHVDAGSCNGCELNAAANVVTG